MPTIKCPRCGKEYDSLYAFHSCGEEGKFYFSENLFSSIVIFFVLAFGLIYIYKNLSKEMMEIMRDTLISAAAIITSLAALNGISIWRKQLRGTHKYQISREILEKTYELQDVLRSTRIPFVSIAELNQREQERRVDEIEASNQRTINNESYALWKRIKPAFEVIAELKIAKFKAKALWGEETIQDVNSLIHKAYELRNAQSGYFQMKLNPSMRAQKIMDKYWRIIYEMPKEEDSFWKEVEVIVSKIEDRFRPYLT